MTLSEDLKQGRLNHPGTVRVDKIYTLSQSIVLRTFGRVNLDEGIAAHCHQASEA
jgi:hypothetical protein